jgi:hypothetical protein
MKMHEMQIIAKIGYLRHKLNQSIENRTALMRSSAPVTRIVEAEKEVEENEVHLLEWMYMLNEKTNG